MTKTRGDRERPARITAGELTQQARRDRRVLGLEDFTEEDLHAIRNAEPPAEALAFDHEMTDGNGGAMPGGLKNQVRLQEE